MNHANNSVSAMLQLSFISIVLLLTTSFTYADDPAQLVCADGCIGYDFLRDGKVVDGRCSYAVDQGSPQCANAPDDQGDFCQKYPNAIRCQH
jgi:hypothetical protein